MASDERKRKARTRRRPAAAPGAAGCLSLGVPPGLRAPHSSATPGYPPSRRPPPVQSPSLPLTTTVRLGGCWHGGLAA